MKKLMYSLFSILFVMLMACGGDAPAGEVGDENTAEEMVDEAMDEMEEMMEEEDDENEKEISVEAIPQNIKDAIAEKYPGYTISEADEVTADDGSISYDVEIEMEGSELEVMYSAAGEFLGEEIDADEEGDVDENDDEDTDM